MHDLQAQWFDSQKKLFVSYVCSVRSGTCSNYVEVTSGSLFCEFLRHSLIQKLSINLLLSVKTRTAVPPRWQQQGRLPHGSKVSSVDAHICVATSPLTLEATRHMDRPSEWPHRWACHGRMGEVNSEWELHSVNAKKKQLLHFLTCSMQNNNDKLRLLHEMDYMCACSRMWTMLAPWYELCLLQNVNYIVHILEQEVYGPPPLL